jgi:hypothetical protein
MDSGALSEAVGLRFQAQLLDVMGSCEWDDSHDYKSERSR